MSDSLYHSMLRVGALTLALVLLFDSGLVLPITRELSDQSQQYLANSVGVFAGVEKTELSEITAELTRRENELAQREASFNERQIAVDLNTPPANDIDLSTYILAVILFILLVLIVLNYVMDYTRLKRIEHEQHAA